MPLNFVTNIVVGGNISDSFLPATGLHDYSPYLALHTVLDFWEAVGHDRARQYMEHLATQAGIILNEKMINNNKPQAQF